MRLYHHDNQPASLNGPLIRRTLTDPKGDCRLPHESGTDLPITHLSDLGILYYSFPPSDPSSPSKVEDLATTRQYANHDEITVSPSSMGAAYEEKIKMFFDEHMHEDEEIRYTLKGNGYFDVRDKEDKWVRIRSEPGDLLVLPAGIYHRFTVDEDNYINAMRLFQTQPNWASLNRSEETETNDFRKNYIQARAKGFAI